MTPEERDAIESGALTEHLLAEIERLRAALKRIAEYQCDGADDDANTCARIASDALNQQYSQEGK